MISPNPSLLRPIPVFLRAFLDFAGFERWSAFLRGLCRTGHPTSIFHYQHKHRIVEVEHKETEDEEKTKTHVLDPTPGLGSNDPREDAFGVLVSAPGRGVCRSLRKDSWGCVGFGLCRMSVGGREQEER